MEILIGIGVAAMFAAVCVLGWLLSVEKDARAKAERDVRWHADKCKWRDDCIDGMLKENAALRNDLHNAINIRKAKNRGITGRMRVAIEEHEAETTANADPLSQPRIDRKLWSILDSEVPNA